MYSDLAGIEISEAVKCKSHNYKTFDKNLQEVVK